jgi:uncharacterized protein YbjT (DUF2867 family)
MELEELKREATALAGRDVEVVPTVDGQYIVEWFNFNSQPPPKGSTEEEALSSFIEFIKTRTKENTVDET